jgi:hypothetical protein
MALGPSFSRRLLSDHVRFQCGRPDGITIVGDDVSGTITPCAVSASVSWVSKSLSSMAPVISMTTRPDTIRLVGAWFGAVIGCNRGECHMHIAVREIKPRTEIGEGVLYRYIVDEGER